MDDGTGGVMTLNSGGMNHNWVFLDVQGQYGQGFHFKIHIYGFPPLENGPTLTIRAT